MGTLRQRIASLIARFRILPKFSHAWVPGAPQKTFALKLGFSEKNIRTGFYCADLEQFNTIFQRSFESKKQEFPKSILYVGRYLPFKGVELLWKVFARLVDSEFPDWKLICLGTGDLWEQRMQHPKIEHVGFVQPENMHHYLEKSGIFILPSTREPWGVVVQEMAAAGLPLICSNAIGAASAFLENNRNGFRFEANDEQDLEHALRSIMQKDQQSLVEMGRKSHELAQKINQEQWVKTLLDLL